MDHNAANHVAHVPELVLAILDFIPDENVLFSLVQTSRGFYALVVDILWNRLRSFDDLVETLPDHLIKRTTTLERTTLVGRVSIRFTALNLIVDH